MERPKVSVLIITFNHAKFIRNCIDSVLNQKTNFNFEILVGDDVSTDNTREILLEYSKKYPTRLKLVFHENNLGDFGKSNWVKLSEQSAGDFIHILEGDDYWIDENKLQMQADFLEKNPKYSICFTNTKVVFDGVNGTWPIPNNSFNPFTKEEYTIDDLIGEDEICFMHTSSIMFRRAFLEKLPEWFFKSKSGDIPLAILLAKKGPIHYIPKFMSVYRKQPGGISYTDNYDNPEFINNRIQMYEGIDKELDYKYHNKIKINLVRYYYMLVNSSHYKQDPRKRLYYLHKLMDLKSEEKKD